MPTFRGSDGAQLHYDDLHRGDGDPVPHLVDAPSDAEELIDTRRGERAFGAALAAWAAGPEATDDAAFNAWQARVAPLGYAAWGATEQAHAAIGWVSFAANRAYFSVDPPQDLAARLGGVTAPVLVVAGARDCVTGVAPVLALAKLFAAGEAVMIERCGHHPWVEQPAAFRQAVDRFLGREVRERVVEPGSTGSLSARPQR